MKVANDKNRVPVLCKLAQATDGWSRLAVNLRSMAKRTSRSTPPVQGHLPQQLDTYSIYVIDPGQGHARLTINGEETVIRHPHVVACEPGDTTNLDAEGNGEETLWEFRFDLSWEQSAPALLPDSGAVATGPCLMLPLMDFRTMRLCLAMEECWRGDALEQFRCQSLFQEMLYYVLRHARKLSRQDPRSAIAATKDYMDRHFRDKLTIGQLADMTWISQGYFLHLFKTMYGLSPIEYIGERRMEEARRLLRRIPAMPLHEIARTVGYEDEGYFGRRFRQRLGLSPNAYRNSGSFKAVAMNYHTIGHLLALQLIPSAARLDPRYVREYYERYHSDVELHLDSLPDDESTKQSLIRHNPDLIVVRDNTAPAIIAQLKQLASVIVLPWNPSVQWRDLFRLTASFLQKEAQAERWLLQYERQAEFVRKGIPLSVGRESLLILAATEEGVLLVGNRHVGTVLFQDIGLTPAFLPPVPLQLLEPEMLESIGADRILFIADTSAAAQQYLNELVHHPVWQGLAAVRSRKVHMVDRGLWFEYTPHAHLWSLNAAAALFS